MLRLLVVLAGLACTCSGLYFPIKESETKCFIEELPIETMVVGKYRCQAQNKDGSFKDSSPGVGIHVEVKDPTGDIIMDKDYEGTAA